jgi:hypothetical protein
MKIRAMMFFVLIILVPIAPVLVIALVALCTLVAFRFYFEAVATALFFDILYAGAIHPIGYSWSATILTLCALVILEVLRENMRWGTRW